MGGGISRQVSYVDQYRDTLSEHEMFMNDRENMYNPNNNGKGNRKGKGKRKRKKISDYDSDYDNDNDNESNYYNKGKKKKGKKGKETSNSFDRMFEELNRPYYMRRNSDSSSGDYDGNNYRKNKKKKKNNSYDKSKRNRDNSYSYSNGKNKNGNNNNYKQKKGKKRDNSNNKYKNILKRNKSVDNYKKKGNKNYKGKGYYDKFLPYYSNRKRNNLGNNEFDDLNDSQILEMSYYSSDDDREKNSKTSRMKMKGRSYINKNPMYNNQIPGSQTNRNPYITGFNPMGNQRIPGFYYNNPRMYNSNSNLYNNQRYGLYNSNLRLNNFYPNNNLGNYNSSNFGLYKYNSALYPRSNDYQRSFNFSNSLNERKSINNFPHSYNSFYNKSNLSLKMDNYYNYTIKDVIYSEYQRHRNYLDSTEKKCAEEMNYNNFSNCGYFRYSKSILLHQREITSICSIIFNLRNICYATGSKDLKIKLWKDNFECIYSKENLQYPPLVLLQYQTRYLLSAEGIYIKLYDLNSSNLNLFQTLRDHIGEIRTILILNEENLNETNVKIISGGKDKTLRLWNVLEETVIRYYQGHRDTITNIQYVGNKKNTIISMSIDKCFIVWEINTTNIIVMFNNYFSATCILGTKFGFCCGSYDNKIRFYDKNYNMIKCLVSNFYNCDNFLMLTNNNLIFTTALNELIIINIDTDRVFSYFRGLKCDIRKMIKCYDWDLPETNRINQLKGVKYKNVLTVGNDGYIYIWECYIHLNSNLYDNESDSESFDSF